jgi:hypothetical protein
MLRRLKAAPFSVCLFLAYLEHQSIPLCPKTRRIRSQAKKRIPRVNQQAPKPAALSRGLNGDDRSSFELIFKVRAKLPSLVQPTHAIARGAISAISTRECSGFLQRQLDSPAGSPTTFSSLSSEEINIQTVANVACCPRRSASAYTHRVSCYHPSHQLLLRIRPHAER